MVRDGGGVCALRMTIAINSGNDEHRENEEGCFGAKATVRPCGMATGFAQRVREGGSVNSFASSLVAPTIETFLPARACV
jgi:hypothetical protein